MHAHAICAQCVLSAAPSVLGEAVELNLVGPPTGSDSQDLRLVAKAYGHPIRLRARPLELVHLLSCKGEVAFEFQTEPTPRFELKPK